MRPRQWCCCYYCQPVRANPRETPRSAMPPLASSPHNPIARRPHRPFPRQAAAARCMGIRDLWRAAQLMVKRYGADASVQAAMRADDLLAEGDHDGAATWRAILRVIEELGRVAPRDGEAVN